MAIENLSVIEQTLQLPEGTLQKAIESQEAVKIELPELEIFKKDEYSSRIENLKSTFQKQGQDFLIKEAKSKFGLDFEGKTIDAFAESLTKKAIADAKITPDEKVKELQSDLEKLRNSLAEKDNEINKVKETYTKKEKQHIIDSTLFKKLDIETSIPKEDVLLILKSKYEIDIEDNKIVFKKDGDVLKNDVTLNPKTIEEVFTEFLPNYTKKPTGGAGGGNETGGSKPNSMKSFQEEMINKGVAIGSAEFNQEMQKRIASKTLSL